MVKRQYVTFLTEAGSYSDATIDSTAKESVCLKVYTKYRDFKTFYFPRAYTILTNAE